MRIVSWNFLEGGLGPMGPHGRPPLLDRRLAARALMDRLHPDVLVLNEALYCAPYHGQYENYAQIFGFPYQATQLYADAWGNCILSRLPILRTHRLWIHPDGPQNRGWLAICVEGPDGPTWISTYHPHPHRRPERRAADVQRFVHALPDGPSVLCGDFNAVSPEDSVDRAALLANFMRFSPPGKAEPSMERFLESGRQLFGTLLPALGWQDAIPLSARVSSMPTGLIRKPDDQGMRIDHMVVSPQIHVRDAWIELAPEADVASDHYPVVLDL